MVCQTDKLWLFNLVVFLGLPVCKLDPELMFVGEE